VITAFAKAVNGIVHWPGIDNHTPEIAIVEIPDYFGPDESLEIDFLPGVHGLSPKETDKHADYVALYGPSGEKIGYRVIHPVHVACNIVENYVKLNRRSTTNLDRLRSILPVIQQYIAESAKRAYETGEAALAEDARWSIRTLLKQSNSVDYAQFTHDTGIDLLDAIPHREDAPIDGLFWDREYGRLAKAVKKRREKLRTRLGNIEKLK